MMNRAANLLLLFILSGGLVARGQTPPQAVRLEREAGQTRLLVEGKPFLILGGELGNSSASSMDYLRPSWEQFRRMNLNTLIAPVYWELMEPEEGHYDFSLVDSLIREAAGHQLRLVLLWFGTWKNSMSCYAPEWMKTDAKRFPRTADTSGRSQEIFSAFGQETLKADEKAFAALMKHLKETDGKRTVVLVQVENEIGMLSTAREISAKTNALYKGRIPRELGDYLKKNADKLMPELRKKWMDNGGKTDEPWENVFGQGIATEEKFQAWYYARYANAVAAAGKKEYDLPMYVNAALPWPGAVPGRFPSGGPLPQLMDIWKAAAPAIDILSPDFYNPNTQYWCDLYVRGQNPLFIPEMRFDRSVAAKAFFVVGHYRALGFSPFSIESESDASALLGRSYAVLSQLAPVIMGRNWLAMEGFIVDGKNKTVSLKMGNYEITVSHYNILPWASGGKDSSWGASGGMIIQTGTDEFLVAGTGFVASFSNADRSKVTNIASCDEVRYVDGREVLGRRMNGDQDHQGRHVRFAPDEWGIQKLKLYNSPGTIE